MAAKLRPFFLLKYQQERVIVEKSGGNQEQGS
jgi:hypothetical protein